ncbi:hypothetical protein NW762_009702 [Fusarium torreyae]|uniref:Uncharacterized protein n=1 Tax=Fusarium torreyae TaxID=1237075 RepID=A0A9W8RWT7_9HYPO|nr:hypothetical protein NW762_009702 [Fusarium torreyae]
MAGRRMDDLHRSPDYSDRPTDYRDRSSDRYRSSRKELFPGRGSFDREDSSLSRDHEKDGGREAGMSHGKRSTNALHHGSRTSWGIPGRQRGQKFDYQAIAELFGDMAYHRTQFVHAESRLRRTKNELNQSTTRPTEFASVDEIKRRELQTCENDKAKHEQKLGQIYQKLQAVFDSFIKQSFQQLQPTSPDDQQGTSSPQKQSSGPVAGLEVRLMELQKSTTTWMENHLSSELAKFKDSISDRDSTEHQILRENFDNERKRRQLLEEKIEQFERKLDAINSTISVRVAAEFNEKARSLPDNQEIIKQLQKSTEDHERQLADLKRDASASANNNTTESDQLESVMAMMKQLQKTVEDHTQQLADLKRDASASVKNNTTESDQLENIMAMMKQLQKTAEDHTQQLADLKLDASASVKNNNAESNELKSFTAVVKELQKSAEDHTQQLAGLKRDASGSAKPSTAEDIVLQSTVEMQGRKIGFLQTQLDPVLLKVQELKQASESSSKDAKALKVIIDRQSVVIGEHGQKQDSLGKDIASLRTTSKDQAKKHSVLDEVVSGLTSTLEANSKKHESLAADVASLNASNTARQEAQKTHTTELRSLGSRVEEQQKKSDALEQKVASFNTEITGWSLHDLKGLAERIQEYPPSTDLKRLLTELPPSQDLKQLLSDLPPSKELRQLLLDLPLGKDLEQVMADLPSSKDLKGLITDLPKLRELTSGSNKGSSQTRTPTPTPAPTPAPVTREMVIQTVESKVREMDKELRDELRQRFSNVAEHFGKLIDEGRKTASDANINVTNLMRLVADIEMHSCQVKKEAREVNERLQKRCSEQETELNSLKGTVTMIGQDIDKARKESKAGTDDVQFQISHLTEWAKNFGSKQWHDSVAQQIAAYVPAHFNGQLDSLNTRVGILESRGNDSDGANKRRKGVNGSPLVVNGAH